MRDRLPTIFLAIDYHPVTARQTELLRQLHRDELEVAEEHLVIRRGIVEGGNHLLRNNQDVSGSLRADIVKCQTEIIFIGNFCRDGLIENLEEDVIREHDGPPGRMHRATIAIREQARNGDTIHINIAKIERGTQCPG